MPSGSSPSSTAGVVIFVSSKIKPGEIVAAPVFTAGMVAMIALFGLAWMADTFISGDEKAIVGALSSLTKEAQ